MQSGSGPRTPSRSPRRPPRRSGGMASVGKIGHSRQHHNFSMPPKSPELNPVENIWQFMRDNWLSNRVFKPTTISSTTAARHGTSSSTSLGGSCPLVCANGRTGSDKRELV